MNSGVVRYPEHVRGDSILLIWGGSDIHPSLYDRENQGSIVGINKSERDIIEWDLLQAAINKRLMIIGICRGAQMLCAAAGGILIQDALGHGYSHMMTTKENEHIQTSSLHHQLMYPWNIEHKLFAWHSPKTWEPENYSGLTVQEQLKIQAKERFGLNRILRIWDELVFNG
mgnify:CR=1 FL=1